MRSSGSPPLQVVVAEVVTVTPATMNWAEVPDVTMPSTSVSLWGAPGIPSSIEMLAASITLPAWTGFRERTSTKAPLASPAGRVAPPSRFTV